MDRVYMAEVIKERGGREGRLVCVCAGARDLLHRIITMALELFRP